MSSSEPPGAWIEANLKPGERLGYDPWLHTPEMVERLAKACRAAGGELVAARTRTRSTRSGATGPAAPLGAVSAHPARLGGESAAAKIARVRAAVEESDGLLVSDAHDVAWLFNIRGADVAHTPLPLSFAYLPREGRPTLFVDGRKLSSAMRARLGELADIDEPDWLVGFMTGLGAAGLRVAFDAATAPARLTQALEAAGGDGFVGPDPIALMKAVKNKAELAGARAAHIRDGAAMARFLCWFDREAPRGKLTEIAAAQALETFRRETGRAEGHLVSHHRRRRPACGDPPLPRQRGLEPAGSAGASSSSTAAANTRTAPPTSPARFASARPTRRDARPLHSRAQGPYRDRARAYFPRARAAPRSTPWRARRCGAPGSTSTTARATASARISRSTRARSGSPRPARSRSRRA